MKKKIKSWWDAAGKKTWSNWLDIKLDLIDMVKNFPIQIGDRKEKPNNSRKKFKWSKKVQSFISYCRKNANSRMKREFYPIL